MDIKVRENNSPLLWFRLKKKVQGEASTTPYLLDGGAVVELYVKNRKSDADNASKFTYVSNGGTPKITISADGTALGATASVISIQCLAVDMTPPGSYPYHLDVVKGAVRETVRDGFWIIEDI